MKQIYYILIISLVAIFSSCATTQRTARSFVGQTEEILIKNLGEPTNTIPLKEGGKIIVYTVTKHLDEVPISTAAYQEEKLVSAAVTRKESVNFYINKEGTVTKTDIDTDYIE